MLFAGLLNVGFTIVEIVGGILTNSVAILSDALHDLGDSIALLSAYFAEKQAERPADKKRTFGYARISLFSAVFNAVILLVGSVFILIEAVQRLFAPEEVHALGMVGIAVFGVAINLIAYYRLRGGESANEKILSWHLLEDVLGWVAVLIGAVVIYFTDFFIIDPILTVGYTIFILWNVVKGLREVLNIFMQGVPQSIDVTHIREALLEVPGVVSVHDMHVWSLDGEHNVFTGHLVVEEEQYVKPARVRRLADEVLRKHHISHSTIEVEIEGDCPHQDCGY